MLFHEFGHVEAHQGFFRAEKKFGEATSHFGFADTRGPKEKEAANWTERRFQTGAAAANSASKRGDGFVLTDDALMELGFDAQKFLLFVFLDGGYADASPARDDFFDVFAGDDAGGGVVEFVALTKAAQIFFFLALFFGLKPRLLKFMIGDGGFHTVSDEFDALLHFADFFRNGGLAQLHARSSFVDQIDGLVWKETIWNIAV